MLTRNEFTVNVTQAIESFNLGLKSSDIEFIVNMVYDPSNTWYYNDFYDLAHELNNQDCNVIYALSQIDAIPDLMEYDVQVRDWFSQNKEACIQVLKAAHIDMPREGILFVDIFTMVSWLKKHEKEYRDCLVYVKNKIKVLK